MEVYRYRYTDPANPTESVITDPLGNPSTFNFERDPDSNKALLTHSTGICASCGSAPDTQQFREDPNNPLRVTRTVNARGVETRTAYDGHGQMTSRIEAAAALDLGLGSAKDLLDLRHPGPADRSHRGSHGRGPRRRSSR